MANVLWRALVVLHRYLGVAVGLLMAMWFVSGIVMMYVGYPRLLESERLRVQAPISWPTCCRLDQLVPDDQPILRAQIEDHAGTPTLRLRRAGSLDTLIDLAQVTFIKVDESVAERVAVAAAARIIERPAAIVGRERIDIDQWTLGRYFRDRPLHRFDFDDPARTSLYVSGTAGQLVLWTTASERFWNWLGTIPHWLYFTPLRTDVALWSQIVIWTSLLGTFLTVLGVAIGVTQFRRGRSPYRGWFYWHHVAGLVFGLLTLTFVVSGLLSMNPWGLLESRGAGEASRIQGTAPTWREIRTSLEMCRAQPSLANAVSLTTAPLAGRLHWLATRDDGSVTRLDASGDPAPASLADLAAAAQRIAGEYGIAEQGLISAEDSYYFRRRDAFVLPAYRVIIADVDQTRYYLDPTSGALLQRTDANGRWHRWLFGALHRLDFAFMRERPLWDLVMLLVTFGGVAVAITGCYLALRRIGIDVASLLRRRRQTAARTAPSPSP